MRQGNKGMDTIKVCYIHVRKHYSETQYLVKSICTKNLKNVMLFQNLPVLSGVSSVDKGHI